MGFAKCVDDIAADRHRGQQPHGSDRDHGCDDGDRDDRDDDDCVSRQQRLLTGTYRLHSSSELDRVGFQFRDRVRVATVRVECPFRANKSC